MKRSFEIAQADQLPRVMQRAFNIMLTGRRGPVHIDLPMDVQCAPSNHQLPEPINHRAENRPRENQNKLKSLPN